MAGLEILAGGAKNALFGPVQVMRELAAGRYPVFVVKANGQPKLKPVTFWQPWHLILE
jgi:hypothetical protein